jgi:hypothetical protein
MRYIAKPATSQARACIHGFIQAQLAGRAAGIAWEELPLDYPNFTRTSQLRALLIEEQNGLCAYTGVGLDNRLIAHLPVATNHSFKAHIEHLKSQQQCREELLRKAGVPGRDEGEDIAYENIVAAVEVVGATDEHFGAVYRKNRVIPVIPTQPECEALFMYLENGDVLGHGPDANGTITILNLNHPTPSGWRKGAIRAFATAFETMTKTELEDAIQALEDTSAGPLREFAFVVAQVAKFYLAKLR